MIAASCQCEVTANGRSVKQEGDRLQMERSASDQLEPFFSIAGYPGNFNGRWRRDGEDGLVGERLAFLGMFSDASTGHCMRRDEQIHQWSLS